MESAVSLKLRLSNELIVKGLPGIGSTFPRIEGVFELRLHQGLPQLINSFTISFITIDRLTDKYKDSDKAKEKINFEISKSIDVKSVALNIPFVLPIKDSIAPTNSSRYSNTTHYLKVDIRIDKKLHSFPHFPIVIQKYDVFPRAEAIYKEIDTEDRLVRFKHKLSHSTIGKDEKLKIDIEISPKSVQTPVNIKEIQISINEVFTRRSNPLYFKTIELQKFNIPDLDKSSLKAPLKRSYLFDIIPESTKKAVHIVGPNTENPIPMRNQGPMSIDSIFVSYEYEVKFKLKYNSRTHFETQESFRISSWNTQEAKVLRPLIKRKIRESKEIKDDSIYYDEKYKVWAFRRQPEVQII